MAATSIATSILRGGIMRRLLRGAGPYKSSRVVSLDHSEGAVRTSTRHSTTHTDGDEPQYQECAAPLRGRGRFGQAKSHAKALCVRSFGASALALATPREGDRGVPRRARTAQRGTTSGSRSYCLPPYSAPKNSLLASTVGLMVRLPSCQLAGQTSPCFSLNCSAFTMRSASSTLRPSGRSFTT